MREKETETTRQESGHWQGHDAAAPAGGDIRRFRETEDEHQRHVKLAEVRTANIIFDICKHFVFN